MYLHGGQRCCEDQGKLVCYQKVVQNEWEIFVLFSQIEDHEKLQPFWEDHNLHMISNCHTENKKILNLYNPVSQGIIIYMLLVKAKIFSTCNEISLKNYWQKIARFPRMSISHIASNCSF